MRTATWIFAACLASACSRSEQPVDREYTVVIDRATVDAADHDGRPWCGGTATPLVDVEATVGAADQTSAAVSGLQPSWNEPLVDAAASDLRGAGLFLEVWVRCGGDAPVRAGAALIHPDAQTVARGAIELTHVGNVSDLRLRFVAAGASDGNGAVAGGDYVAYDPGSDDGWEPPPGDDGPSVAGSDDPGSAGETTSDDGASGDGSSDDSGDCGCDRHLPRGGAHPAVAARRRFVR